MKWLKRAMGFEAPLASTTDELKTPAVDSKPFGLAPHRMLDLD
ncbi:hypothetical protein QF017_000001, partial [Pseudomonas laurylsulfatiphila]